MFAAPIQYEAENGYMLIDNTVIESQKAGFKYENKANSIKTYFPEKLSDGLLLERGEEKINVEFLIFIF